MKLTSIGTVGRLGSPFVFDIPKSKLPQGGQRTIAGPYTRYRTNPPMNSGMLGYIQEGAYDPMGDIYNAEIGIFEGQDATPFFEDFGWLEDTSGVGAAADEYTSAQAEAVRESVPNQTIDWLKKFADDTGISNATKQIVNIAVQKGINVVKDALTPGDVGKKVINPANGKQGTVKADPNNPGKFIIQYDDGKTEPYGNTQLLVQGTSRPSSSNNNMLLIAGVVLAAAFLMK